MKLNQGSDTIAAVICAAGVSSRMAGVKKEYRLLPTRDQHKKGLTVLGAAVSAFAAVPEISAIVIAVPDNCESGETAARNALPPELLEGKTGALIHFIPGSKTRRASVFNALNRLSAFNPGYVLIHDGARPWISPDLIRRIIAAVKNHGAVIPLMPLTETPKETDSPFDASSDDAQPIYIKNHLKRAVTGTAQTPQAFTFAEILGAHQKAAVQGAGIEFTDDAEVWAAFCGPVAVIPGEAANRKITFPEDIC